MAKKVLFVASVMEHIKAFHEPYIQWFKSQGCEVHVVAKNEKGFEIDGADRIIDIPFVRSPYSLKNIAVYKSIKNLIETERYDIMHCHTPMASVVARLAARKYRKQGLKIIYTAHGFHFFKGGPLLGWILYYPIESLLAYYTDAIITINHEDYQTAIHNFKCDHIFIVPGIGVNTDKVVETNPETKRRIRQKLGYSDDDFILFYAAEFIPRKNHRFIIETIPQLKKIIPQLKVLLAGRGDNLQQMAQLVDKLGVENEVDLLGYRTDVSSLVAMSDVGISSSRQEGLPIGVAEDLFAGIPVVVTAERGHKEMVVDGVNGYLFDQEDRTTFIDCINKLYRDADMRIQMGHNAKVMVQPFSIGNALRAHVEIYKRFI